LFYFSVIFSFYSWAGLECHPSEIQRALDSLAKVEATHCQESAAFREAMQHLKELRQESSCHQKHVQNAIEKLTSARIDPLLGQHSQSCKAVIKDAKGLIERLLPRR
jgi:hypothetical protein